MKTSTDQEALRKRLSPIQYHVTMEAGTERAFTGIYWDHHADGLYRCVVCNEPLFDSGTKFESGTGWPSFFDVLEKGRVEVRQDRSYGMSRDEVVCANCGAHLGHVFPDGPRPTGLRYCINSAALEFSRREQEAASEQEVGTEQQAADSAEQQAADSAERASGPGDQAVG